LLSPRGPANLRWHYVEHRDAYGFEVGTDSLKKIAHLQIISDTVHYHRLFSKKPIQDVELDLDAQDSVG